MNDRAPIRDRTLVLRILVPGLEARLRDKMKEMEDTATSTTKAMASTAQKSGSSDKNLFLDLEGVTCEPTPARNNTLWSFHCDGATYPAKLVNLPCPIELHKTHDHAVYYKSADVAQMLIVYEDDIALEEADEKPVEGFPSYYHSGLAPPLKRVVERRFLAREHKALAPPRAAAADVEVELMELMEKIAKDDKSKRNKVPTLTSANKVLEEVEEEVVDYEPWMSDFGRQKDGVEFDADDQLCSLHPEVWLSPSVYRDLKEQDDAAKRKKQESAMKKEAKRKEKFLSEAKPVKTVKKGIASKKNKEIVDEVTQAATSMLTSDGFDLMGAALEDDDFFGDLDLADEDMNFDDVKL